MTIFNVKLPAVPGNNVVNTTQPLPSLLTQREVMTALRLSRATLLAAVSQGTLPAPIRLTKRVCVWRAADIISRLA